MTRNKNIKKLFYSVQLITLIFYSCIKYAYCQEIKTIEVAFKREVVQKDKKQITNGKIFSILPNKIWITVDYPIKQILIIEDKEMKIYYPDENKTFRILSKNNFYLPFFHNFLAVAMEDFGLSDMGYTIANYEKKDKQLISYWNPPKQLSKIFDKFILEYRDNKITRTEVTGPTGNTIMKTLFKNHIQYGAVFFPLEIQINYFIDPNLLYENILFADPKFNASLPLDIINFKIPADSEIKEIEW